MACLRLALVTLAACSAVAASAVPGPLSYNETLVAVTRVRLAAKNPASLAAYQSLLQAADALVAAPPNVSALTVTAGTALPPSGDMHDYISASRYYWPCNVNVTTGEQLAHVADNTTCNETTGLPWVMHDGIVNWAAIDTFDGPRLANFTSAFLLLAQAAFWSGNTTYAALAAHFFRVWFLLPDTRMNPNMNFAQTWPGVNNGSSWGIIDMDQFLPVMDGVWMLVNSSTGAWYANDTAALLDWLAQWSTWMQTSPLALNESVATNNHHTYFNMLTLTTALWLGNMTWALDLIRDSETGPNAPIGVQIWADGELPMEEARTNSLGYVNMDLSGLFALGTLSRNPALVALGGDDLFTYVSANGSTIRGAVDYLVPFAVYGEPWPHEDLEPFNYCNLHDLYVRSAMLWSNATYVTWATAMCNGSTTAGNVLWWPYLPV